VVTFTNFINKFVRVINYDFCYGATFPSPSQETDPNISRLLLIRRECRGLIFDKDTGKVLARRFHKFFNIGESDETSTDTIDFKIPHMLTEKVDG
jgi:RNA ligase